MFRSVRWRIAFAYIGLIVVSTLLLSGYVLRHVRDRYLSDLESSLAIQARLVATEAEPEFGQSGGSSPGLNSLARRLGQETGTRITFIRRDGLVLGDSHEDPATMENHGSRPEVVQALGTGLGATRRHSRTVGYDMMYVAVPIQSDEQVVGVARVSLPLTAIDNSLSQLASAIALAALATTLLAVILAVFLARAITRPLGDLARMARRMAEGRLDERIYTDSASETREVGEAFNQMAAQLQETVSSITSERNRAAAILANMADGIAIVDEEGRVSLLNPAAGLMLRTPHEHAMGRSFVDVARDHELAQLVQDCLDRGVLGATRTRLIEWGLPRRYLRAVVTPIQDDRAVQALVVLQDVSELRRLEAMRREFIANVSHELRTPLASIKALVETLREGALEDPAVADDFLARVEVEVDGLTQMVRELLELSRIESGQVPLKLAPVEVAPLLEATTERLRPQAERAGLTLAVESDAGLPPVMADAERVQQVIVNLVHNAIKFTPPRGRVAVSARLHAEGVAVAVADTGMGIANEDLPRLFERFYKTDRSRSSGGTGLGLAIAKHIVQAHGGHIWAESPGEGRGATFHFTLPVHLRRPGTPPEPSPAVSG